MSNGSRVPGARQAVRLGVLFTLHPGRAGGALSLADLEPLARALAGARLSLDGLRFAAEDAVAADPLMPGEARRADVLRHGHELAEALMLLGAELDVLRVFLRSGGEEGGQHAA